MDLAECLKPFFPPAGAGACVVALVGAGGKTTALFALAAELSAWAPGPGPRILLTTTTNIIDPRTESGRRYDRLLLEPGLAPEADGKELGPAPWAGLAAPSQPGISVLASEPIPGGPKLRGIVPGAVAFLAPQYDWILVEADGSRGLPVKAPAAHEPAVPEASDLVLGIIGLDCLGRPMDEATVHRSALFGSLVGLEPSSPIAAEHLARLVASPAGIFKNAPAGARRILILNKAELLGPGGLEGLAAALGRRGGIDLVLACSLGSPSGRVLAVLDRGVVAI